MVVDLVAELADGRVVIVADVDGVLVDRASGAALDPARIVLRGLVLPGRRDRPRMARSA